LYKNDEQHFETSFALVVLLILEFLSESYSDYVSGVSCVIFILLGNTTLTLQNVAGMLSWSNDSHYFFTRNDNMPTALWIWDICRLELAAVLVQKDPIRAAAWDPTCTRLVLCTESPHLYMWTPSGACCVNIPLLNFRIIDLKWNSNGSCLLLKDRESFCCATIISALPEEEPDQSDDTSEDE